MKLTVIVEDSSGDVVATQQIVSGDYRVPARGADGSEPAIAVYRRIVAGPGQCEYQIDLEMPMDVLRTEDVDRWHQIVKDALRGTAT
jgi:hypothetical protein